MKVKVIVERLDTIHTVNRFMAVIFLVSGNRGRQDSTLDSWGRIFAHTQVPCRTDSVCTRSNQSWTFSQTSCWSLTGIGGLEIRPLAGIYDKNHVCGISVWNVRRGGRGEDPPPPPFPSPPPTHGANYSMSVCVSVSLCVCLSVCLCVCLCVCQSGLNIANMSTMCQSFRVHKFRSLWNKTRWRNTITRLYNLFPSIKLTMVHGLLDYYRLLTALTDSNKETPKSR